MKELLDIYYKKAGDIVEERGLSSWRQHNLVEEHDNRQVAEKHDIRRAEFILFPSPTAECTHARVRIKLPKDGRKYKVSEVRGETAVVSVRYEVYVWDGGGLVNDNGMTRRKTTST